ncbi:MAG: 3-methyl-2-oxobutanoate dehydrogenase subunit VorB [Eubacteriales bacterium]|nr:3-methyl-2-oxobutanoate dehydrogenase subunit VorB [Eubacteriales bacterium]MDY5014571.1 3-methyl-2-oxobutanoate dehydrogenase subunit VorB [Eubacteriales bacterium]
MSEKVIMKGNEALAEAAIRAGCRCFFGYPITPQTEVAAYMSKAMPKAGGVYLQAESEIAAINMIYGASASGVRCMTSSSSPGISLKSEGISYICGADLPAVIVNMTRGGPGLGGIQPAQSDYYQATRGIGHGDARLLVFAPAGIQEMVDLMTDAFDKADEYRMPAMILGDGAIGQMMEPVTLPEPKANLIEKPWATTGTNMARPHNIVNSLYLQPEALEKNVRDRFARYAKIEETEARCEEYMADDADILIASYGIASRIAKSAIKRARAEGIKAGLLRPITLWPFPKAVFKKHAAHAKAFLDVELNMGQMIDDVRLSIDCARPVEFAGRTGGMIITPDEVLAKLREMEVK